MSQETDEVIANYWVEHYMNHKLCSLCGNCGNYVTNSEPE